MGSMNGGVTLGLIFLITSALVKFNSSNHIQMEIIMKCVYQGCKAKAIKEYWCDIHWGFFPHACEFPGCDKRPIYDDEPYCFTHSPNLGLSVPNYSAYEKSKEKNVRHSL